MRMGLVETHVEKKSDSVQIQKRCQKGHEEPTYLLWMTASEFLRNWIERVRPSESFSFTELISIDGKLVEVEGTRKSR